MKRSHPAAPSHLAERFQQYRKEIRSALRHLPTHLTVDDFSVSLHTYIPKRRPAFPPPIAKLSLQRKLKQLTAVFQTYELRQLAVLAAVSGGIDSVVLIDTLLSLFPKLEIFPVIFHFNHQLRGMESDRDAEFVRKLAQQYGLPLILATAETQRYAKVSHCSIEEGARNLRYTTLRFLAEQLQLPYVCTAHTKNDLAETVLLNFLRGTSVTGLAGIPRIRSLSSTVRVFRPLLDWSRQDISAYAEVQSLRWIEDSSNQDLRYTRNRIRHILLPLLQSEFNPNITDTLHRTAQHFQSLESYLQTLIAQLQAEIVQEIDHQALALRIPSLRAQPQFLQQELIARLAAQHFALSLTWQQLSRILSVMEKQTGTIETIHRKLIALRDRHLLILTAPREPVTIHRSIEKKGCYTVGRHLLCLKEFPRSRWRRSKKHHYVDSDKIPNQLILRTWKAGDIFQPLGMPAPMKLSDFLTNQKVPVLERPTICVLTTLDGEILYVCGYQISEQVKVTDQTRRVLRLEWKRATTQDGETADGNTETGDHSRQGI